MVSHKMRQFLNLFNFITLSPVASRFLFSRLRVTAKDKTIIWDAKLSQNYILMKNHCFDVT